MLTGKHIIILGAGRSGKAAAALALREGATVSVHDQASEIKGFSDQVALHPNASEESGKNSTCDLLIVSPGIDTYGPLVRAYAEKAEKVTGEMQFAWNYFEGNTIAITGTNGKTTTTELIDTIMNGAGISCLPCGNYGMPLSEVVLLENPPQAVALECSSFQLETIDTFKPEVAVWLNFAPDHMDRYPTVEAYYEAKLRIFENQNGDDIAVIRSGEKLPPLAAKEIIFSTEEDDVDWYSNGYEIYHRGKSVLHFERDTPLRGLHNAENLMAALAACEKFGVSISSAIEALKNYTPPAHRCEFIRSLHDVDYLNDSKATNLHALESALRSQMRPIVLIAGGKDKGLDYTPVIPLLAKKALSAVTYGQIAKPLEKIFSQAVETHAVTTLDDAVLKAQELAPAGSIVLLSPGTSSFDQFTGYEHRGDTFRNLVKLLD